MKQKEKAVLVGLVLPKKSKIEEMDSLDELAALAETADVEVVDRLIQERTSVNPATFIGAGKVKELENLLADHQAHVAIFDDELTPAQIRNLEKALKKKVIDRSALILDIFASRARTHEAQTQVELAQLEYFYPRLTRQWSHLSRQYGAGVATRGPGETQLETDRRLIRKRIGKLKSDLEKIEKQRAVRRKKRETFKRVALVGYTNVGKSSLMNVIAEADTFVENQLFATLDATIRSFETEEGKVLLVDTVGFVRKLPHHLVASFRSTLEESIEADLLLHVVDVSHPRYEDQIAAVEEVLRDLGVHDKPMITVFNKVDALEDRQLLRRLKRQYDPVVFTSAVKGLGVESLRHEVLEQLSLNRNEEIIRIPAHETRIISQIYELGQVLKREYDGNDAIIHIRSHAEKTGLIQNLIAPFKKAQ